ncbi:hypothetical protein AGMMS49992_28200 [Clostridia bacterium]|nr:hypothetical protein AGMMS49992_28200 [Clostridia bacterium]
MHGYVEQCSNDSIKTMKEYSDEVKITQYNLYEQTFKKFCAYICKQTADSEA